MSSEQETTGALTDAQGRKIKIVGIRAFAACVALAYLMGVVMGALLI